MKLPCGALAPPALFGVAKSLALAHPGITTDAIYIFVKADYPRLNPRWMKKVIGQARYAARRYVTTPKTKPKPTARVRSSRIVLRRVYHGWVTVEGDEALPEKVDDRTEIIFGSYKWRDEDRPCRITVEIYGSPPNSEVSHRRADAQ